MLISGKDLYRFSTYVERIDLTFHQYLIFSDEPILIHTGNVRQAEAMLPQLKSSLNGKDLKYIFISHFESDECGGISTILKHYPNARPVCSQTTAQQLYGFGLAKDAVIKGHGETLKTNDYELEFIAYPSEMHLWGGLLAIEKIRGVFFSSDLMMSFGKEIGTIKESDWDTEVGSIRPEQVPDPEKREQLQNILKQLSPSFVAAGHGPCLKL